MEYAKCVLHLCCKNKNMSLAKIFSILGKIEDAESFDGNLRDQLVSQLVKYNAQNPDSINDTYAVMDLLHEISKKCMENLHQELIFRIDKTKDDLTSFGQVIRVNDVKEWTFEQNPTYFLELQTKKNQDIKISRMQEKLLNDCNSAIKDGRTPPLAFATKREIQIIPFNSATARKTE